MQLICQLCIPVTWLCSRYQRDMTVVVMHGHITLAEHVLCNIFTGPGQASSTSSAAATAIAQAIAQVLVSVFASISSSGSGEVPSMLAAAILLQVATG